MDVPARYKGEDIAEQEREWRAQRIGWVVMTLLLGAALVGLLGDRGPAARTRVATADGVLEVSYVRLEHHHAPSELVVAVAAAAVVDGEVRLWLDAAYAQAIGLDSVLPEPERVEVAPERVVYVFAAGEPTGSLEIVFAYQHDGYWRQTGTVGLVDGPALRFSQFVFP